MSPALSTLWIAPPAAGEVLVEASLEPAARAQLAALQSPRRRADWRASRALLQRVAPPSGAGMSLAHSQGHAALLVAAEGQRAGVDLERVRPRCVLDLAVLAFAEEELVRLRALPAGAQTEHFFVLWTLKEAFAKALGLDLTTALRSCAFVQSGTAWAARVPTSDAWRAEVRRAFGDFIIAAVLVAPPGSAIESPGPPRWWPDTDHPHEPLLAEFRS